DHFVQHDVRKAFDLCDAVADFANDPDALACGRGSGGRDVRFDFLHDVMHTSSHQWSLHSRACSAASFARTLPSYTVLPTLTRSPPMSAGFSANDVSTFAPCVCTSSLEICSRRFTASGVARSTRAVYR